MLAAYLRRVRAAAVNADHLLICAGMAQALGLALRALAADGIQTVAFENPGARTSTTEQAAAAAMTAVPVAVEQDGLDVSELERSGARAVLVTPAHQWPTGVVLAGHRRQELIAWARQHNGVIIEDDLRRRVPLRPRPGRLASGARPGLCHQPGNGQQITRAYPAAWLAHRPRPAARRCHTRQTHRRPRQSRHRPARAGHPQRVRPLLPTPAAHASRIRVATRRPDPRRGQARPDVRVTGLAAGFHAVLHLPPGVEENKVIDEARQREVGLYGMAPMGHTGAAAEQQLIVGFGDTTQSAIQAGIAAVADLLRGD